MRQGSLGITVSTALVLLLAGAAGAADPPGRPPLTCPVDAVKSGGGCIDKYEASVWRVPNPTTVNTELVGKIKRGVATVADLTAGGATPLGTAGDDYAPCADSGQNCVNDIFAASLPGVTPSAFITWFQAQQACTNAGKRLPTNAEWQAAAAGTPDAGSDDGTTDCNTSAVNAVAHTGSRNRCVSSAGAFDMVGNLFEWVAEWVPRSTACGSWGDDVSPTGDLQCLAGAATNGEPGALLRGGGWLDSISAGPLAVAGEPRPSDKPSEGGFRCAR